jgi:putative pyruvate formate lyase activating enzyme
MNNITPAYINLLNNGELEKRVERLFEILSSCKLCPWKCGVDRTKGEKGRCNASNTLRASKAVPHFGEEPVLSGFRGSGTIFFSHCNLKCCFCQNYQISQEGLGNDFSVEELSSMMLDLQEQGCHNINLVSPAHYLPYIIKALFLSAKKGLSIPLVYNSNGYDDITTLRLLENIVDIYLPDIKYSDDVHAMNCSSAINYSHVSIRAVQEMFRQVGLLSVDSMGIALKGLIIRHLVLPGGLSGTDKVLKNIRKHFGPLVSISLMGQYRPCYNAYKFEKLKERISREEYFEAVKTFESLGFENGWVQEWENLDREFLPDFSKKDRWS